MTRTVPTPVNLRTVRTALTLAVLVGCEPLADGALEQGGSETHEDDSLHASVDDTGMDSGAAHAAVHIPAQIAKGKFQGLMTAATPLA